MGLDSFNENYHRIGGDVFQKSDNPKDTCKVCKRLKFRGIRTHVLVCTRCDVTPESIGVYG